MFSFYAMGVFSICVASPWNAPMAVLSSWRTSVPAERSASASCNSRHVLFSIVILGTKVATSVNGGRLCVLGVTSRGHTSLVYL